MFKNFFKIWGILLLMLVGLGVVLALPVASFILVEHFFGGWGVLFYLPFGVTGITAGVISLTERRMRPKM